MGMFQSGKPGKDLFNVGPDNYMTRVKRRFQSGKPGKDLFNRRLRLCHI